MSNFQRVKAALKKILEMGHRPSRVVSYDYLDEQKAAYQEAQDALEEKFSRLKEERVGVVYVPGWGYADARLVRAVEKYYGID